MDLKHTADAAIGPTPTDGRHRWFEHIARAGYAARGLVYALIGVLAIGTAIGAGGDTTGPGGALRWISDGIVGRSVLAMLAPGLVGYAVWCTVQAVRDTEGKGSHAKGLCLRAGMLGSAFIHAGWAVAAASLAVGMGSHAGGDDASAKGWTATLMMQPLGRFVVAAIAVGIVALAIGQLRMAVSRDFERDIAVGNMRRRTRSLFTVVGRGGLAAYGLILGLAGGFLLMAAWRFDPGQAHGLGGTLASLLGEPFGTVLLGAVAVGVIAFGAYNVLLARFRLIRPR